MANFYEKGQEIFRCYPIAHVIEDDYRPYVCDVCVKFNNDSSFKKCSQCHFVYYCSTSCQKQAWKKYHSEECQFLKKFEKNR